MNLTSSLFPTIEILKNKVTIFQLEIFLQKKKKN